MLRHLPLVLLPLVACGGGGSSSGAGTSTGRERTTSAASTTTSSVTASTSGSTSSSSAGSTSGGSSTSGGTVSTASGSTGALTSSSSSGAVSSSSSTGASSSSGGAGYVSTLAGGGDGGWTVGSTTETSPPCESGTLNATGIAVDAQGTVYVADGVYARVCMIFPDGGIVTLAGNGQPGDVDGSGGPTGTAEFGMTEGVAVDDGGNIYVTDPSTNQQNIRKIAPDGTTTTLASNPPGTSEEDGNLSFYEPWALIIGGDGNLYEDDYQGNTIRQIFPDGGSVEVATGFQGSLGLAVNAQRGLWVSSYTGNEVLTLSGFDGGTLLSGWGFPGWLDGPGAQAELDGPKGMALDAQGNLIVADSQDGRVRRIAPDGTTSTVAGNGSQLWADGTLGPNGTASFVGPQAVAIDSAGNIYVADQDYVRVIRFQ